MPRKDIEFQNSVGITIRGWLYTPSNTTSEPLPCIVAAHGWSAVKEMGLDAVGEAFVANLKIAVLIIDNRGFGASDAGAGQPRLEIIPSDQISDFSDAITYAQTLPEVEPKKIGIWGSSYSGGHVLVVAATDKRVKAVISQVSEGHGTLQDS
jgi:cephalosporin-C deacetylase-like acetyl esterase